MHLRNCEHRLDDFAAIMDPENAEHKSKRRNLEIALAAARRSLQTIDNQIDFAERQVEGLVDA